MDFVQPSGFVASCFGQSSVMGMNSGSPYTVALDENTRFFTPCARATSHRASVPAKLFQ